MGFGHRVYKNYDPRARIIKKHVDEVLEATEHNPLIEIATELEKQALDDEFFTSRKLYPNVDFYSGLIYEALELPTEMFTVMFAIPRTSGWVAQWLEMIDDPEQKIARPRQIYTGDRDVDYVPIADREGPEKIRNEAVRRRFASAAAPDLQAHSPPRPARRPRAASTISMRRSLPSSVVRARPRGRPAAGDEDAARVRARRTGRGATRDLDRRHLSRHQRGVDVMGDGASSPSPAESRRRPLEPLEGETPFDAVRRELAG